MIKVRVTKAGMAGASSFLALAAGIGACAAPAEESVDSTESGITVQNAGTGTFNLTWAYGTTSGYTFTATNSTDEYVRTGEKMNFSVPAYFLWQRLHPNDAIPNDLARLQKLKGKLKAAFFKGGTEFAHKTVSTTSFTGTQTYDLQAVTGQFTINAGTETVKFELVITDAGAPGATATMSYGDFLETAVIGGSLPNKTVLFDTDYGQLRQRVLEGGKIVRGSNVSVGYTDWRAATIVDSSTLDRNIGGGTSYGRFGSFEMPLNGNVEYEITFGLAVDGVHQDEQKMTGSSTSRLLTLAGRTAYEGSLAVPASAQHVDVYFHIKAWLVVDYNAFPSVKTRRYNQGDRILLREKWDNLNGQAFADYDFVTEAK